MTMTSVVYDEKTVFFILFVDKVDKVFEGLLLWQRLCVKHFLDNIEVVLCLKYFAKLANLQIG